MERVARGDTYDVIHPRTGQRVGQRSAREVFNAITDAAWRTGDPGLIYLDAINRANPTPGLGPIEATNPCGEIPLLPHEACNLGSINLAHMLAQREGASEIDWEKLRATTRAAVRFLDDVIDVNNYPIPEIEHMARGNRKIGLGVMGFAEMLIRLGISYHSDQAIAVAGRVMEFMNNEALVASQQLAEERGVFPFWKESISRITRPPPSQRHAHRHRADGYIRHYRRNEREHRAALRVGLSPLACPRCGDTLRN